MWRSREEATANILAILAAGIALFARIPSGGTFVVDVLPASLVAAVGMSLAHIPC